MTASPDQWSALEARAKSGEYHLLSVTPGDVLDLIAAARERDRLREALRRVIEQSRENAVWQIAAAALARSLATRAARPPEQQESTESVHCPFAASDWTPCYLRDGDLALTSPPVECVGCRKTPDAIRAARPPEGVPACANHPDREGTYNGLCFDCASIPAREPAPAEPHDG